MANESQLRPSEIKDVLLSEIENYEEDLHAEEVGEVLEVKDGVARIYGLTKAMASEMLEITSVQDRGDPDSPGPEPGRGQHRCRHPGGVDPPPGGGPGPPDRRGPFRSRPGPDTWAASWIPSGSPWMAWDPSIPSRGPGRSTSWRPGSSFGSR